MKLKRFAVRALVALAITVALCMFFARTVQTITTPKVRLLQPANGRLDRKIELTGEVYYAATEGITVDVGGSAVTVSKVKVKAGQHVEKGDVIFTARIDTYDADMEKLRQDYMEKAGELAAKDADNSSRSRESRQNELYEDMLTAQENAATTKVDARIAASRAGIPLGNDITTWKKQLALADELPDGLMDLVNKAIAASSAVTTAGEAFTAVKQDKKMRVSDEVFDYIKERNKLISDMDGLLDDMVELEERAAAVGEITAPRSGWIISVAVTEGAEYSGAEAAYVMSAEETEPSLRAALPDGDTTVIENGTKVSMKFGEENVNGKVTEVISRQGKRYVVAELPEEIRQSETAFRDALNNGISVTVNWKASDKTTLLPAACVRTEGTTKYVFTVETRYGGFLQSDAMKLVKQNVTVLGQNDKYVSIAEDLTWQQVAYQEDRAVQEGSTVMQYLN